MLQFEKLTMSEFHKQSKIWAKGTEGKRQLHCDTEISFRSIATTVPIHSDMASGILQ